VPQGKYSAFVPDPLPPAVDWTPRLFRLLGERTRLYKIRHLIPPSPRGAKAGISWNKLEHGLF